MENCGRGHDVSEICCNHAEMVQERLRVAEMALEEIDALSLVILVGGRDPDREAEKALGQLLFGRVQQRAAALWGIPRSFHGGN